MSTRKEKIPIVRFRAFSEPWFQNQLSEVAEFSKGRGYSKKDIQPQGTPIILYGRLYTKYESVISNIDTYANMEKNSVISEGGEVIIPASGESSAEISRASCVTDGGVILGGDINIVKPHENLDSSFIAITLSNGSQQRELSKRAQGKSVVHLHNSDLKAVKLFYPSYEEQSDIGSLFRNLDDLLVSYKNNLANYQSLKATMLSKMFPKAGQTVPEIRLDGFEGEWEIKKFKSISNKRGKSNSKGYDYPAYSVSNQSGLIPQSEQFEGSRLENLEKTSYKIVEPNEFAYNPARINVGSIAFNDLDETVIVSSLYVIFSLDKSINNDYALLFIKSPEFNKEVRRNTEGSVREYLFYENFANIRIPIPPTFEEQQAIGSYFSNLDNLINSHQEKISQLETLKKKLLQDMFI